MFHKTLHYRLVRPQDKTSLTLYLPLVNTILHFKILAQQEDIHGVNHEVVSQECRSFPSSDVYALGPRGFLSIKGRQRGGGHIFRGYFCFLWYF